MAYVDDVIATGPQHVWTFNNVLTDAVGSVTVTNTGGALVATPLVEDSTHSYQINGTGDRATVPNTADINNSTQTQKAFGGWIQVTSIQLPPKRLYGEGGASPVFQLILLWGNNLIFEVLDSSNDLQAFSNGPLVPSRIYHVLAVYEGSASGNSARLYVDGVQQTLTAPANGQPGGANLAARTPAEFGDPAGTSGLGGGTLLLNGMANANHSHWASWTGTAVDNLDATTIRVELFERGARPDVTISTDTAANMQTALDALASTVRPNVPLCIRVEPVSGGGDFTLDATALTFDPLASIHVQYTGTDTLTWRNDLTSNASIFSAPDGTIITQNETTLTLTGLQNLTEVRVFRAGTTVEVAGQENVTSGTFVASLFETSVDIQIVSLAFQNVRLEAVDTSFTRTVVVSQAVDRTYSNL